MNRRSLQMAVMVFFLFASSCGDDTEPPVRSDFWEEATIFDAPPSGAFYALAFSGSLGYAAGETLESTSSTLTHTPYLVTRMNDDTWAQPAGAPFPAHSLISALGFAPGGEPLMAGVDFDAGSGFILDQRNEWSRHNFLFGGRAFATAPGIVRVAGAAAGDNAVLKSTAADIWIPEPIPFPANDNERALTDISAANGIFVACGFDDGAEGTPQSPNSVLFRNTGGGWERLDAPCGGCSNREFRAVAVTPSGSFFLGGAVTDFSAGSTDAYRAFLLLASGDGNWAEITLPEPGELDRVNDILIATGGDIYLACGVEGSTLVRLNGAVAHQAGLPAARIAQLAEAPDGSVWAAGSVLDNSGENSRPALWKRIPE